MNRAMLALCAALLAGCAGPREEAPPLEVVPHVDLSRYLGTWYEIASYPTWFQRDCTGTTATYSLRPDGEIDVENRCRKGSLDGEEERAVGVAWPVKDDPSGAKLEVQFFWPFRGDYWIIELDPDYRWAVVGHPTREYLWILSRTPKLDAATSADILRRIAAQGYDPTRLRRTPQRAP
jgi:apolipoprotein D and lipocalin family protein